MSESDDRFPIDPAPRPALPLAPVASLQAIVQRDMERLYLQQREETDRVLQDAATACFHLGRVRTELAAQASMPPHALDALEIIEANLREALERRQVRIDDYEGQPWQEAWRATVNLRGYQCRDDLAEPRVAHMESPAIFCGDRLIAKGAASIEGPPRE
jgi:hypothetical protein